jgi:hypothetical protein
VARRWQGVAGDLVGATGKVSGKEERAGAHRNGGSTVRREESSGTTAFAGEEGALVVVVECDEVLQLGRGKGVRELQEIVRIGGSGRSSPGNGGKWRRSAGIRAREGLPVARGGGPRAGRGGERCGAREGGGEEWVTKERTAFRVHFERPVGGAAEREKGRERGVRPRECHTVRDGGLGPGNREGRTNRQVRPVSGAWAHVGRPETETEWPSPDE